MANPGSLRYRFFSRSKYAHHLFPKLGLRILIYIALIVLSGWLLLGAMQEAARQHIADTPYQAHFVYVFLGVFVIGEVMLRFRLMSGRFSEGNINQLWFIFLLTTLYIVTCFCLRVYLFDQEIMETEAIINFFLVATCFFAASSVTLISYLVEKASMHYYPIIRAELESHVQEPTKIVVAKSTVKDFFRWYEGDGFDEMLFDAQHADEFTEEAYHEYRMGVAREYLEAGPYQLEDYDNVLLMDVVFVFEDSDDISYFINDCAKTVHHGNLVLSSYTVGAGRKKCHVNLSYEGREVSVATVTGYKGANRILMEIGELLAPEYGIRECRVVRKDEDPYFMSLPIAEWQQLEEAYGLAKMQRYFRPVDANYNGLAYYMTWRYRLVSFLRVPASHSY